MDTLTRKILSLLIGSTFSLCMPAWSQNTTSTALDGTPYRSAIDATKLQQAAEAYESNHWVKAFTTYADLADAGHYEAARIAYQMWRYGVPLYSTRFLARPEQLKKWHIQLSASAPSPNFAQPLPLRAAVP